MAANKYAKVLPYIGQQVEITGTEVTLSNNYDVRSFELQTAQTQRKVGSDERAITRFRLGGRFRS